MLREAIEELRAGRPVLIFDSSDREGETDIVFASQFASMESIRFMRKTGGGLICTTMREKDAGVIGLPFLEDLYSKHLGLGQKVTDASDLKYDVSSSFSVTINHRSTFTGIPDRDRSLTIRAFASYLKELPTYGTSATEIFAREFRIPGHVILLIARDGYFRVRRGHTELSTYLVEKAGLIPSATIVEMLDDNGYSLSHESAAKFAEDYKLTFIEGKNIIDEWIDDQSNGYGSF